MAARGRARRNASLLMASRLPGRLIIFCGGVAVAWREPAVSDARRLHINGRAAAQHMKTKRAEGDHRQKATGLWRAKAPGTSQAVIARRRMNAHIGKIGTTAYEKNARRAADNMSDIKRGSALAHIAAVINARCIAPAPKALDNEIFKISGNNWRGVTGGVGIETNIAWKRREHRHEQRA